MSLSIPISKKDFFQLVFTISFYWIMTDAFS